MTEHVHGQVDHGCAWDEGLVRPDKVGLDLGTSVEHLGESGPFVVAGELPLVEVELLLEDLILKNVAEVLLVDVGGLHEVGQVCPDEGADLVDLLGLQDPLDRVQVVVVRALHDGEVCSDAKLRVFLGIPQQSNQWGALKT